MARTKKAKIDTVEDLIAELTEHFLNSKIRVLIRGDGVAVPIEEIARSVVDDGLVYLEIELK